MKIGFVVNSIATEHPSYTTVRLALAAARRGHETWIMGVDDFSQAPDGTVGAHARTAKVTKQTTNDTYFGRLSDPSYVPEHICIDDLDVLFMRNDPADDIVERPWAVTSGVLFGQLSVLRGTLVVNDPASLANAINKTYFQHFPEVVRPHTLISRNSKDIADFIDEMGGSAVLKPLQGSGGAGVFFVSSDESPNVNQMIEALGRDGYIVVQEVLEEADKGDVRLFLVNGEPIVVGGQVGAFRRVNTTKDRRSNISAGGKVRRVKVTDEMLELARLVRPKLLADGMFFVGLDIVGNKLMEVNVFSPGGLGSLDAIYDKKFTEPIIDALEHKVELSRHYGANLDNITLAGL